MHDPSPGKISLNELFMISEKTLTGQSENQDKVIAVKRPKNVLNDEDEKAATLATTLSEEVTERVQFLHIADTFLKHLAPAMILNAKNYSDEALCSHNVSGISGGGG